MYVTRYGVKRTTVYLPDELKSRLEAEARRRGLTEAQIIREAVDKETRRPRPHGGIFSGGDLNARDIDPRVAVESESAPFGGFGDG
ncbi:MAG: CopG family transcriptional regulator [Actinomycetales bacterium]